MLIRRAHATIPGQCKSCNPHLSDPHGNQHSGGVPVQTGGNAGGGPRGIQFVAGVCTSGSGRRSAGCTNIITLSQSCTCSAGMLGGYSAAGRCTVCSAALDDAKHRPTSNVVRYLRACTVLRWCVLQLSGFTGPDAEAERTEITVGQNYCAGRSSLSYARTT